MYWLKGQLDQEMFTLFFLHFEREIVEKIQVHAILVITVALRKLWKFWLSLKQEFR